MSLLHNSTFCIFHHVNFFFLLSEVGSTSIRAVNSAQTRHALLAAAAAQGAFAPPLVGPSHGFNASIIFSGLRQNEAKEAARPHRLGDHFIGPVVHDGTGDVAPVPGTQAIGILLKHETRRG